MNLATPQLPEDFDAFWRETLILAGMTGVFLTLSVRNFKIRLE